MTERTSATPGAVENETRHEVGIPITPRQVAAIQNLQANVALAERELSLYVTAIIAGTEHETVELVAVNAAHNGTPPTLRVRVLS